MKRQDILLKHLDRRGHGLEIGPSYNPVAPKKAGFHVDVIDYLNREQLLQKYDGHGVDTGNIEDVDFIWRGESYAALTGRPNGYDWVIASHVIEHTPDLIGFLKSCEEVLQANGVLSLAIPDKRYCFDRYRAISGLGSVIDRHLSGVHQHTSGSCTEFYLHVTSNTGRLSWDPALGMTRDFQLAHATEHALNALRTEPNDERDVHAWVFVPSSFRLLVHDLHELGLIRLHESAFVPTKAGEFFMTLSRNGKGSGRTRLQLLKDVERELRMRNLTPVRATVLRVGRVVSRLLAKMGK